MLDPATAIGLVASAVQIADVSARLIQRINQSRRTADGLPEEFIHIRTRLAVLEDALRLSEKNIEQESDDVVKQNFKAAVASCTTQIKDLKAIIDKALPEKGASNAVKGWKAVKSLKYDDDVRRLDENINKYMNILGHYQMLSSLRPIRKGPRSLPKPAWHCPHPRDLDFVDRDALHTALHKSRPGSAIALVGGGGMGKTHLATELCYRMRAKSPQTWFFWASAKDYVSLEIDFRKIGKSLGIAGHDNRDAEIFHLVYERLSDPSHDPWVMVLDSVDDTNVLTYSIRSTTTTRTTITEQENKYTVLDYLKASGSGSLLITSCNVDAARMLTGNCAYHILVESLQEAEAMALFNSKLGSDVSCTDEEILALVAAAELIPLAISQLASRISMMYPRLTVKLATERLLNPDEDTVKFLTHSVRSTDQDSRTTTSIVKTWYQSFRYVREFFPSAARLFSLMCQFDGQDIPEPLLLRQYGEREVAPQVRQLAWWKRSVVRRRERSKKFKPFQNLGSVSKDNFEEDWSLLKNMFLIRTKACGHSFYLHRLIQQAMMQWLQINNQLYIWKQRFVEIMGECFPQPEHENWMLCRYLLPHAQHVAEAYPMDTSLRPRWIHLMERMSEFAQYSGDYGVAEILLQKALAVSQPLSAKLRNDRLRMFHALGSTHAAQKHHDEAEVAFRTAWAGRRDALGCDHLDTLESAHRLRGTLLVQKKWEEGEKIEHAILTSYGRVFGPDHAQTREFMISSALSHASYSQVTKVCSRRRTGHHHHIFESTS